MLHDPVETGNGNAAEIAPAAASGERSISAGCAAYEFTVSGGAEAVCPVCGAKGENLELISGAAGKAEDAGAQAEAEKPDYAGTQDGKEPAGGLCRRIAGA